MRLPGMASCLIGIAFVCGVCRAGSGGAPGVRCRPAPFGLAAAPPAGVVHGRMADVADRPA